jgi:hypothetical protein
MTTKLPEAIAARDELLAAAGRGEPVTAQEIRAAEDATRDAEAADMLASRNAGFAKAEAEREAIGKHAEDARAIDAQTAAAVSAYLGAARDLDSAMAGARAAASALNMTAGQLAGADREAHRHNSDVNADALRHNATLRASHESTWPRATTLGAEATALLARPVRAEIVITQHGAPPPMAQKWDKVLVGTAESAAQNVLPVPLAEAA